MQVEITCATNILVLRIMVILLFKHPLTIVWFDVYEATPNCITPHQYRALMSENMWELICARRPCSTRRISRAGWCGTICFGKLPQPGNSPKVSDDVPWSLLDCLDLAFRESTDANIKTIKVWRGFWELNSRLGKWVGSVLRTERYKQYASRHGQDAAGNPSGGNLFRGLYNIVTLASTEGYDSAFTLSHFLWLHWYFEFSLHPIWIQDTNAHQTNKIWCPKPSKLYTWILLTSGSKAWAHPTKSLLTFAWINALNTVSECVRMSQAQSKNSLLLIVLLCCRFVEILVETL